MKKMQKHLLKFLAIIGLFVSCQFYANGQASAYRLKVADSLFVAKRFTQSLEHYEAVLKNNEYTHTMLLRMALIHEGLDQPGKALYYLNLYHLATNDRSALQKMEDLALKYNLSGYQRSDVDVILTWYYDYHFHVAAALAAGTLFLLALAFYQKRKMNQRPVGIFATICSFLVLLFLHLNFGEKISVGIVSQPNVYVMTGPSAGADVKEIISEGHRIEVIGKKDVWLKVRWDGTTAYIKENAILPVTLAVTDAL